MKSNKIEQVKKALLESLESNLGVVTDSCKQVGISRTTFYEYIKTDPEFGQSVKDIENISLDFAESHLFKQIREGNTAATIFYLKTKGKRRGYIERLETEQKNINYNSQELSKDQLDKIINKL